MYYLDSGTFFFWRDNRFIVGHASRPFETVSVSPSVVSMLLAFSHGADLDFVVHRMAKSARERRETSQLLNKLRKFNFIVQKGSAHNERLAEPGLINLNGFELSRAARIFPDLERDKKFMRFFEIAKPYTFTQMPTQYTLYSAIRYLVKSKVEGDIVECGVWRGGSMMMAALTLKDLKDVRRKIHLFDTFDGSWDEPSKSDRLIYEAKGHFPKVKNKRIQFAGEFSKGLDQARVLKCLALTGYPKKNFKTIPGLVQRTLPKYAPTKIALLRLDTDFFDSTYHELETLYPKLQQGGVLIVDDYGKYNGATKAVDHYFKKNKLNVHLQRIDIQGAVAIKQQPREI